MYQFLFSVSSSSVFPTISCHARLSGNTSRNQDNLGASQAFSETRRCWVISFDCALGVDVRDISGDTCEDDC